MDELIRKNMKTVVNARFLCQPLTGVQRFAIEISLRLKDIMGDNIVFVAPKDIRQHETANKLDVIIIGTKTGHLWEQWDLLRYLRKMNNPLLLCLGGGAPYFYKNLVFTLHDIVYVRFPQSYSFAYRLFYNTLLPQVLRNAKSIITVSEFSKKEISDYYKISTSKIQVVYNAVGNLFSEKENNKSDCNKNYKYFLSVSSPAYHKNFNFLVSTFLGAPLSNDVKLLIVGQLDSSLYQDIGLDEKVKNNNRIEFLGRVSDDELVTLYKNAEAFIFPSLYEGFGIPPIEAQSCGSIVLSSNAASLPEILGKSALYFSPNETSSLQNAIVNLLKLSPIERQKMQLLSDNNLKRYNWNISAKKVVKILND